MRKTIKENRQILRRCIRLIGGYPDMLTVRSAIQYFIIIHNFLGLEEKFYDQCTMANKNLNKNLRLITDIKYISAALRAYEILSEPSHKVRFSVETLDGIEDIRVYLKEEGLHESIYTKLIL